jgi:glyoxylase-like metal-dependent hydrolase (beta-lactamase superfamily II)
LTGQIQLPPEEVAHDIFRLQIPLPRNPLKALNSYVIRGPDRNLIVDTGMRRKECLDAMNAGLESLGVDLRKTDFFITHFHADHLGLVSELAGATSKIYMNAPDARHMLAQAFRGVFAKSARLHGFPEEDLQQALDTHPGFKYGPTLPLSFSDTSDNQRIICGRYNFHCVETPGHSFGHTCLYEAEHKILIAGDHVLNDITPNIQAWWEDDWNPLDRYLGSLAKIVLLDVGLVLPGHRNIFTDLRGRVEELKEHHDKRAEEVLSILTKGPQTAYRVASEMTWDIVCDSFDAFPLAQKWFAAGEAIAHVKYLAGLGKIRGEIKRNRDQEVILWSLPG